MSEIKQMLRDQAWERAIGELKSIRHTYLSSSDNNDAGKLVKFDILLKEFMDKIADDEIV